MASKVSGATPGYLDVGVDEIVGADTEAVEVARVHEQQSVRLRAPGVVVELERQVGTEIVPRGLAGAQVLKRFDGGEARRARERSVTTAREGISHRSWPYLGQGLAGSPRVDGEGTEGLVGVAVVHHQANVRAVDVLVLVRDLRWNRISKRPSAQKKRTPNAPCRRGSIGHGA